MILDIHTHHQDYDRAVINASFCDFKPSQGLFYSLGIHPWDIDKINIETALKTIESKLDVCRSKELEYKEKHKIYPRN